MASKEEKKGFSKIKLIAILILIVLVIMGVLYFRMKWKKFQASANFGIWMFVIIVGACFIAFLVLRHKAKKAKEEKRQEAIREAAIEQEEAEKEK